MLNVPDSEVLAHEGLTNSESLVRGYHKSWKQTFGCAKMEYM